MSKEVEQVKTSDAGTWYGRMFLAPYLPINQKILDVSLKKRSKSQIKMPLYLDLQKENGPMQALSWGMDIHWPGDFMMHSTSECHSAAVDYVFWQTSEDTPHQTYFLNMSDKPLMEKPSKLSQILEVNPDPKYQLSQKACQGILNRAEKRGKELPPQLKQALLRQANPEGHTSEQNETSDGDSDVSDTAYTLKIRGGVERDSYGKKAGKGALVQTELSATLGVSQDQTLITMKKQVEEFVTAVNQEAKHQQDLIQSDLGVARTLAPGTHASGPHLTKTLVTNLDKQQVNQDQTLITVGEPTLLESNQNHATISNDGISTTLSASMGMGGGYVPMITSPIGFNRERCGAVTMENAMPTLQAAAGESGNNQPMVMTFEPGAASRVGGHVSEDVAYTVRANAGDNQQAVVYGICSDGSNSMKSDNPHSGIYEAETTRTLDNNGGNPACNQGGMVVLEGNGIRESHKDDTTPTLTRGCQNTLHMVNVIENHPNDSRVKIKEDNVFQTLDARMGMGGGNVPMVMETYQEKTGTLMASGYDKLDTQEAMNDMYVVQEASNWDGSQVAPTLTVNNANGAQRMPDKDNFNAVVQSVEVFHGNVEDEKTPPLKARDYKDPHCVSYTKADYGNYKEGAGTLRASGGDLGGGSKTLVSSYQNKTGTLCARISAGTSNQLATDDMFVTPNMSVVRRLTPLECERLQGFPDGWTDIGDWVDSKGKKHKGDADSPRYKALGNSIALPFWSWLADKVIKQLDYDGVKDLTMASLFDGIGGFPLVFSRCGCRPIWASEIEEFPIAVTKVRFPEE